MALKPSKFLRRHSFDALKTRKPNCVRSEKAVMGRAVKFEGISEELQKIIDADMDKVEARRRARDAFKDIQLSIDHCLFKMPHAGLKMKESYEVNSRGLEIFSKSWLPETSSPKAMVYFCHGYGDTCTFFVEGIARKLASSGYGVFAMDYPGFGLSEGLHGYIPSFDKLVDDVIEHYSKAKENPEICNLPSFLFGQSMGGAVALKVHMKQPDAWNGAVLLAPMCKIADDMVPPWLVTQILVGIAKFLPKQKLVPQQDLAELAFRDVKKREQVSLPLLILHGENDKVTDPSISKTLYEKASSSDKKLILYKDAYHSLLEGEPDEMILRVLGDIISWETRGRAEVRN
ncbi:caffeoylshikimate esterase-like isoform X3 [Solanum dulcamara]|uniref:caffeoylshikimate esterase-like isoform X3 n=1 Tax=Solanum dulcamara TaxID=45834 RepID=UPI0024859F57|nr:caffeoylshikimate esterase-like isoform X3 [Solanum dulcamara]